MTGNKRSHFWIALLFLGPNLAGFLVFTLGPILISFFGSLTTWNLRPSIPLRFIGLQNYIELFQEPEFYFYFYNTLYLLAGLPVSIAGALALAVFLTQKLEFRKAGNALLLSAVAVGLAIIMAIVLVFAGFPSSAYLFLAVGIIAGIAFHCGSIGYRAIYYLPHFTAGVGTILLWTQLYNPNFGLINQCLQVIGGWLGWSGSLPGWLTSTRSLAGFLPFPESFNNGGFGLGAREAIMIMGIWAAVGGNSMILYIAGISNIPPELYEAADIDGASGWQRFRYITLPQLAPTTFFIIVMGVIYGLQGGFEQARLMTEGGPAGTTTTLSYYIYKEGFERFDMGYGAAVAWVLFAVTMVVTLINWRYGNRRMND